MKLGFDTHLRCDFHSGNDAARHSAVLEAANCGGTVLVVHTLEFHPSRVLVIGSVPASAVACEAVQGARPLLQPEAVGALHTTWGAAVDPVPDSPLGFLVVRGPLT